MIPIRWTLDSRNLRGERWLDNFIFNCRFWHQKSFSQSVLLKIPSKKVDNFLFLPLGGGPSECALMRHVSPVMNEWWWLLECSDVSLFWFISQYADIWDNQKFFTTGYLRYVVCVGQFLWIQHVSVYLRRSFYMSIRSSSCFISMLDFYTVFSRWCSHPIQYIFSLK